MKQTFPLTAHSDLAAASIRTTFKQRFCYAAFASPLVHLLLEPMILAIRRARLSIIMLTAFCMHSASAASLYLGDYELTLPPGGIVSIDAKSGDILVKFEGEIDLGEEFRARDLEFLNAKRENFHLQRRISELEPLVRWEEERIVILRAIKAAGGAILVAIVLSFILVVLVPRQLARRRTEKRRSHLATHRQLLLEFSEYYIRLDRLLQRVALPIVALSFLPAIFVIFMAVQHDGLLDLLDSQAPLWGLLGATAVPIATFFSFYWGAHRSVANFLGQIGK